MFQRVISSIKFTGKRSMPINGGVGGATDWPWADDGSRDSNLSWSGDSSRMGNIGVGGASAAGSDDRSSSKAGRPHRKGKTESDVLKEKFAIARIASKVVGCSWKLACLFR